MNIRKRLGLLIVAALIVVCAGPGAGTTSAQQRETFANQETSALQVQAAVSTSTSTFASGLMFPRGLKFGPDGYLYVAEAGPGGDTPSNGNCEGFTSPFVPYHPGLTARVSKISPAGERTTVVDKLPSVRDNTGESLGAMDVAFIGNNLYVLDSAGGCSRGLGDTPAGVYRANADGTWAMVANFSAYLPKNQTVRPSGPADWEPDGSVYSMNALGEKLYVVEANHGQLSEVSLDGSIRRVVDISATDGADTPTALAFHDGNFYVGNLSLFPIIRGAANVYRITPGGELSVFARGLTMVLGLAFDAQGRMYALESTTVDNDFPQPGTGRVVRVSAGAGNLEEVVTGLSFPTAMTIGPDGMLYISNFGYGGDPSKGEILRVDLTAPAAPVGMPTTGAGPWQPSAWLFILSALAIACGLLMQRKRAT